jgi:PPM family protein phosphatase
MPAFLLCSDSNGLAKKTMNVAVANLSHAGGRPNNQDAVAACWSAETRCGCWVVADGLGGHQAGEVAAALACAAILRAYDADPAMALERLGDFVQLAHDDILKAQQTAEELADMRTTVVVLAIAGGMARWAHCGDSRLYAFRDTAIVHHTLDDSVPQALVAMGEIMPEAIRFHEDRNRLTRCLGSPDKFRCTVAEPMELTPGSSFLLCTDGFWEYVYEPEMLVDLAKATAPEDWSRLMTERLLSRAPPDHDNYSALALWVEGD